MIKKMLFSLNTPPSGVKTTEPKPTNLVGIAMDEARCCLAEARSMLRV